MKISYRTHPALLHLGSNREKLSNHTLYKDNSFNAFIKKINRDNIIKPSNNFSDAVDKSAEKLSVLFNDLIVQSYLNNTSGVFLKSVVTVFYNIISITNDGVIYELVVFDNLTGEPLSYVLRQENTSHEFWSSKHFRESLVINNLSPKQIIDSIISEILFTLLFKKYAEVEVKDIPPDGKVKVATFKCVNDTKLKIEYLDSKWFTTLIKSEGFNVRGHFRFQVCGRGNMDRKLIWIDEHTKSGYTSIARKLTQNNLETSK